MEQPFEIIQYGFSFTLPHSSLFQNRTVCLGRLITDYFKINHHLTIKIQTLGIYDWETKLVEKNKPRFRIEYSTIIRADRIKSLLRKALTHCFIVLQENFSEFRDSYEYDTVYSSETRAMKYPAEDKIKSLMIPKRSRNKHAFYN